MPFHTLSASHLRPPFPDVRYRKNGTPINAVAAPAGVSKGGLIRRDTTSAVTTRRAPASTEQGITFL